MTNYAQPLRAIGQALELLHIEEFYLEPQGKYFRVAWQVALARRAGKSNPDDNIVRHVWGLRPDQGFSEIGLKDSNRGAVKRLELCYSAEDVERLDLAGKAQRQSGHATGNGIRLSQLLRAIGDYLKQKNARLVRILSCAEAVKVEFKTGERETEEEHFTVPDLAEISVSMYSRRTPHTLH